jgi:hypothetical protein
MLTIAVPALVMSSSRGVLRECSHRTGLVELGTCRLPIRRSPSKLCATLDVRRDCAWMMPRPDFFCPVLRLWSAQQLARREGPHRFTQKRPRTFVPALQRVAAVGTSKNQLSRDFRCRSIFDFLQQYRSKGDIPAAFGQVRSIPETGRRMLYEYTH